MKRLKGAAIGVGLALGMIGVAAGMGFLMAEMFDIFGRYGPVVLVAGGFVCAGGVYGAVLSK